MKIGITGSSKLAGELLSILDNNIVYEKVEMESFRYPDIIPWNELDVFINNAHVQFSQTELLHEAYENWKEDEDKLIINISSRAHKPNISKGYLYSAQKAALNHLADNLTYNSDAQFGIVTLNLGLLEHALESVPYDEVCTLVKDIIFDFYTNRPMQTEITFQHRANYNKVQKEKEMLKLSAAVNKITHKH